MAANAIAKTIGFRLRARKEKPGYSQEHLYQFPRKIIEYKRQR